MLGALLLLLAVSIAGNIVLFRKASRPLHSAGDLPLIERTIALHARGAPAAEAEIRREAFPIVVRVGHGTCVELRRYDRAGHYGACYDRRGRLIEQRASVVN